MLLNIWATFAMNFAPKNFHKSPHLVTLVGNHFSLLTAIIVYNYTHSKQILIASYLLADL